MPPEPIDAGANYWVFVVELLDVVPRRCPSKPNLFVGITTCEPELRVADLKAGKGPDWLRGNLVGLRSDLMPITNSNRASADIKYAARVNNLKAQGFTVNRDTTVWTVYVVELDATAISNQGKGFVYVGETSKTAEERFLEHKSGARNGNGPLFSRVVHKHGLRLRPDLAPTRKYFSQAASKKAEADWHDELVAKGYVAKGGH